MRKIPHVMVRGWMLQIFDYLGVRSEVSEVVVDQLIDASLCGTHAQGIMRFIEYVREILSKTLIPEAEPKEEYERFASVSVDGNWGFGQRTAWFLVSKTEELSSKYGISFGTAKQCNHIGRLYDYGSKLAMDGYIGILTCNTEPLVAAHNGTKRALGTNPICISFPTNDFPMVIDIATSKVAAGFIMQSLKEGRAVSHGLIIDKDGNDSSDPKDFFEGGSLLPFAEYKGFGLALSVDILAGALSRQGCGWGAKGPHGEHSNGVYFQALDVSKFMEISEFKNSVDALVKNLKSTSGKKQVMVPGEPEEIQRTISIRDGLQIDDDTFRSFGLWASKFGIILSGYEAYNQ